MFAEALPAPPAPDTPAGESLSNADAPQHSPSNGAAPRPKRAYKRHRPYQPTRAQRAAFSRNLAKARQALRERGWPHTEKQRAAARENIRRAQTAIRWHGLPSTAARHQASMANLAKANAVLRARGYPRNAKQKEAARANLAIAHAESRDLANYARYHKHKLKHGLCADKLDKLMMLYVEMREAERARRRGVGSRIARKGPARIPSPVPTSRDTLSRR
jgi:hypothetical protein